MTVQDIIAKMHEPTETDITLVTKAYNFAEKAHEGQKRYSGEPYFIHVAETGKLLAENNMSATTIAAGILHDTIEDVGIKPEDFKKEFGAEILFLVEGVTKLGKLRYHGADRHNESLRKFFVATSQDLRVLIIKLADRLHNMRTLQHVPAHKQIRIASETLYIYAPLAYRLGMRKMSRELEDIAFKFVMPKESAEIEKIIKERTKRDLRGIEKFHKSVLKALGADGITKARTDFRVKGVYSLYKKMQRKNNDVEKIYDIAAIRIIVPTVSDCYKALGVIHSIWRPLPGRIKDYIAFPKPNGYRSLHTTVFRGDKTIIEIQIKTEEMYLESEYGIASHYSYKEHLKQKTLNPNLMWIKHLLPTEPQYGVVSNGNTQVGPVLNPKDIPDWIKEIANYKPKEGDPTFEENITSDFLKERIFVFTPKGDVVDLPIDSTPIDFAYSIHSDIGNHMASAKVNGKIASMDSILKNGDIVEILTKEASAPTTKWLGFARTNMAKKHIKNEAKKISKKKEEANAPREKTKAKKNSTPTNKVQKAK